MAGLIILASMVKVDAMSCMSCLKSVMGIAHFSSIIKGKGYWLNAVFTRPADYLGPFSIFKSLTSYLTDLELLATRSHLANAACITTYIPPSASNRQNGRMLCLLREAPRRRHTQLYQV